MKNRRQHYRHEFPPTRPVVVQLESTDGAKALAGDLINLSIGGMCVYASALKAESAQTWTVALPLAPDAPLRVLAERISARDDDAARCGFRFVPPVDQELMDEQERRIWEFLLTAQRRQRRYL